MHELLVGRLIDRFKAYEDLAAMIDDDLLSERIDVPKHKSLAEHLWCVVGARESYARSIEQGDWVGFSCSMDAFATVDFVGKLKESGTLAERAIRDVGEWTEERSGLLVSLAEHEVMHEGQIIRHMYAIERSLPESWVWA